MNFSLQSSVTDRLNQLLDINQMLWAFELGLNFEYLDDLNFGLSTKNSIEKITTDSNASTKQKNKQEIILIVLLG